MNSVNEQLMAVLWIKYSDASVINMNKNVSSEMKNVVLKAVTMNQYLTKWVHIR